MSDTVKDVNVENIEKTPAEHEPSNLSVEDLLEENMTHVRSLLLS